MDGGDPVLFITHPFVPSPFSGSARSWRFYKYLPRFGWTPWVVSCSANTARVPYPGVYRVPEENPSRRLRFEEYLAGRVQRYLFPVNDAFEWVPYAVSRGSELIERHRIACVISTSPPLAAHYAAAWLAGRYGLRWVADFRDPVLDNPFRKRKWFYPYERWIESGLVQRADAIIANTGDLQAALQRRYPRHAGKISVIWNGFDPEERVRPKPLAERKQRVLAHVGEIYGGRKPSALVACLNRLLDSGRLDPESFRLDLVGESALAPDPAYDRDLASLRARGCLRETRKRMPKPEADALMTEADYLLLLDVNESGRSIQVPAKLFDYICAGRPIVAFSNAGSPASRILEASGADHCCFTPDTPAGELDRELLRFLERGARTSHANDWFWSTFDGCEHVRLVAALLRGGVEQQEAVGCAAGRVGNAVLE